MRTVEPYSYTFRMSVKPEWVGQDVLTIFSTRFPFDSMPLWLERIQAGLICVDGKPALPNTFPRQNQILSHLMHNRTEPDVCADQIEIICETNDWCAVFKPAPMPVHPCGRYNKNSLKFILEEHFGFRLWVPHRLDILTSGIVLFAKNSSTANEMSALFAEGGIKKTYLAKVRGNFPEAIEVRKGIRRKDSYLFECHELGKSAHTSFKKLWHNANTNMSLVECTPFSGRTHQIRLHLKEAGFPIWNDPYYSVDDRDVNKLFDDAAIDLCAYRYTWSNQTVTASLPQWAQRSHF